MTPDDSPTPDSFPDDGSIDAAAARLAELAANPPLPPGVSSGDLVPLTTSPDVHKARLAEHRAALMHHQAAVEQAAAEMRRRADAARRDAMQMVDQMRSQVARLEEGISAVNLYLGRDEHVQLLRGGEPAPVGTEIVVRQMVLSADQECLVAADAGGIDVRDIDQFFDWLLADEAHVDQLIPEPKGVVAFVPRFTEKDYEDPWLQTVMDEANTTTWWLIRNGERLAATTCAFRVGRRLVPTRDEFTEVFVGRDGARLEPGTRAWDDAEERADRRQRHYMKIGLVLQGIADRTSLLDPKPDGLSFLHAESYDAGDVRVVTDAERALGTGRMPFFEWLAGLNARLTPGMRVVGAFNGDPWREANDAFDGDRRSWSRHSRLSPDVAAVPESKVPHVLESRTGDGGFRFKYERSDRRWGYEHGRDGGQFGEWPYKKRASCVVYPSDRFVIPFDLVTEAELRGYIEARTERHQYAWILPLLSAVVEAKRAEAAEEAPFRVLLVGELVKAGADRDEAERLVPVLVDDWKLANRWHRPLVAPDRKTQAAAVEFVVSEWARRAAGSSIDAGVVERLREVHEDAMLVAERPDGGVTVLVPEPFTVDGVFCAEFVYSADGSRLRRERRWVTTSARHTRLRVLFESPVWAGWLHNASVSEWLSPVLWPDVVEAVGDMFEDVLWVEWQSKAAGFVVAWVVDAWPGRVDVDDVVESVRSGGVRAVDLVWRRRRDGTVGLERVGSHHWVESEWPWRDGVGRRYSRRGGMVELARFDDVIVRFEVGMEAAERHMRDVVTPLADRASELVWAVEGSALAVVEAEAFDRFMDDYRDASLWEEHRKGLRLSHPRLGREMWPVVQRSLAAGLPVEGVPVAEVAGRAAGFGLPEVKISAVFDGLVFPDGQVDDDGTGGG